jgi:hypothetical protein
MNQRIEKIMLEAGFAAPELAGRANKLAELIIKKCMDVAKYHTPDTEECEYTWLIHDKIKQYFGVEE